MKTLIQLILVIILSFLLLTGVSAANNHPAPQSEALLQVIRDISDRYGVHFTYDREIVEDVEVKDYEPDNYVDVEDALSRILEGTRLKYVMLEMKYVIIYQDDPTGMKSLEQMVDVLQKIIEQKKEKRQVSTLKQLQGSSDLSSIHLEKHKLVLNVSGTVTNEKGEPLIGVNIQVKDSNIGTATDFEGRFTLEDVNENATLVFSYIGYQTQEFVLNGRSNINVTLIENSQLLDEVVVVGYGTQRVSDITGAINTIQIENAPLSMAPNLNILSALKSKAPGLNIGAVNEAGRPPSLLIRGQNSISGSNSPLIVLDGVIYFGSLNNLNPSDIASVQVLKDASSASVYGSRAANGVIIINTKRGKSDKPELLLSISNGILAWNDKPRLMGLDKYIDKVNSQFNTNDPFAWMSESERFNYENGITNNWEDHFSRTGHFQDYQLSVSGSSEKLNYILSSGYTNQKGVIVGDDFDRISLRARTNAEITDWLQLSVDGAYNRRDFSGANIPSATIDGRIPTRGETYAAFYRGAPSDKLLEKWPIQDGQHSALQPYNMNPLWITQNDIVEDVEFENNFRMTTSVNIDVPFIEGFSYRLNYALNYRLLNSERFYHEDYFVLPGSSQDLTRYNSALLTNQLTRSQGDMANQVISNYVFDHILNYQKQFEKHRFAFTLAATRDYNNNKSFAVTGTDYSSNGNTILGIGGLNLAGNTRNRNTVREESNIGYLSRVNYTYNDKYHLTASYRRDGSSVFGSQKKWGDFPSFGLGWTMSEEVFLLDSKLINYLKLRVSYGQNGNQGISAYETLTRVATGPNSGNWYQWSDQQGSLDYGLEISSLGNDLLGWETTTAFNGGLELALLDNRISLDLDIYFSQTVDQLFTRQIPIMTGFSSIRASLGQVDNRGVELSLETINIRANNFIWSSNFTFWQNRNRLSELYGDGLDDISNNLFLSESLGSIYGFEWNGIVQESDEKYIANTGAKPGDAMFKDLNGDGMITVDEDRKILGNEKENFRMNLSNSINYKNFELYVMVTGIFGGNGFYLEPNPRAYLATDSDFFRSVSLDKISYWTPENPSNKYPSLEYRGGSRFLGLQSRTFVRIQDLVLSYTLKNDLGNKIKLKGLKLFLAGQNLSTFSNWDGEPELGLTAISGSYPVSASFTFGIRHNIK